MPAAGTLNAPGFTRNKGLAEVETMKKPDDRDDFSAELESIRKWMRRFEADTEVAPVSVECVIYARFSGRKQKEASIERQAVVEGVATGGDPPLAVPDGH